MTFLDVYFNFSLIFRFFIPNPRTELLKICKWKEKFALSGKGFLTHPTFLEKVQKYLELWHKLGLS